MSGHVSSVSHGEQAAEGAWSIDLLGMPERVLRWCFIAIVVLTVLHLLSTDLVFAETLGIGNSFDSEPFPELFRLQLEPSLPTWFSVALLLWCGLVLLLIAAGTGDGRAPSRSTWLSLGVIFVALSIDEQIGLHEVVSNYLSEVVETGGVLRYTWVIPGAAFTALAGLLYWRLFRVLPRPYPLLFFGAGAIFVSGALVAEMYEALLISREEAEGYSLGLSYLMQDPLEMAGASVFLYALLRYGVEQRGWRRLTLGSG